MKNKDNTFIFYTSTAERRLNIQENRKYIYDQCEFVIPNCMSKSKDNIFY